VLADPVPRRDHSSVTALLRVATNSVTWFVAESTVSVVGGDEQAVAGDPIVVDGRLAAVG